MLMVAHVHKIHFFLYDYQYGCTNTCIYHYIYTHACATYFFVCQKRLHASMCRRICICVCMLVRMFFSTCATIARGCAMIIYGYVLLGMGGTGWLKSIVDKNLRGMKSACATRPSSSQLSHNPRPPMPHAAALPATPNFRKLPSPPFHCPEPPELPPDQRSPLPSGSDRWYCAALICPLTAEMVLILCMPGREARAIIERIDTPAASR